MTHHSMRRKEKAMSETDSHALLNRGEYGILATADREEGAYGVPLSYCWMEGGICFHCAGEGHKLDNLEADKRACFTVVADTKPAYTGGFNTYFASVMVFGEVHPVADSEEKKRILYALAAKYLPDDLDKADDEIERLLNRTGVYKLIPHRITGKAKREQ